MTKYDTLTNKELAEILNMHVSTVATILSRADFQKFRCYDYRQHSRGEVRSICHRKNMGFFRELKKYFDIRTSKKAKEASELLDKKLNTMARKIKNDGRKKTDS